MPSVLNCFGATDIGRRRPANQDQFLIAEFKFTLGISDASGRESVFESMEGPASCTLLVVADGMGGHEAGDRASQLAVESLACFLLEASPWSFPNTAAEDHEFRSLLKRAVQHCQHSLRQEAKAIPERRGMGTTLTLALVRWPDMYVAHAGDSRCYILHEGKLQQMTRDHTLSQLYRESHVDDAQPPDRPGWNNALWNVVSSEHDGVVPEIARHYLEENDRILLCTDGLYKHLPPEAVAAIVGDSTDNEDACRRLVAAANNAGGDDNITVVVAGPSQAAEEPKGLSDTTEIDELPLKETSEYIPKPQDL